MIYIPILIAKYFMISNCDLICKELSEEHKCDIYFGGLLATAENTVWPETIKILPYCDEIVKLNAVCQNCGSDYANYSLFKGIKNQVLTIGDHEYIPVCRECYNKLKGHL